MNVAQGNIVTGVYLFLIIGGLITLFGALIVYFSKKPKKRK